MGPTPGPLGALLPWRSFNGGIPIPPLSINWDTVPERYLRIANPAAGAEMPQWVVPARCIRKIVAVSCVFATDANVANRIVWVAYWAADGNVKFQNKLVQQAAGVSKRYQFFIGATDRDFPAGVYAMMALPEQMCLTQGEYLTIGLDNRQVGDQLSYISITYKEVEI